MSIKEKALDVYKKKKAEDDKETDKDAAEFCKNALEVLKEQFGNDIDMSKVDIIEKYPGSTIIIIEDDIKINITRLQGYHRFNMIKKCEKCGDEYADDVRNLADIGKFLMRDHDQYDCERNIKAKTETNIPSAEMKLVEALRDFFYELQAQQQ